MKASARILLRSGGYVKKGVKDCCLISTESVKRVFSRFREWPAKMFSHTAKMPGKGTYQSAILEACEKLF